LDSQTFDQSAYAQWQDLEASFPSTAGISTPEILAHQAPALPGELPTAWDETLGTGPSARPALAATPATPPTRAPASTLRSVPQAPVDAAPEAQREPGRPSTPSDTSPAAGPLEQAPGTAPQPDVAALMPPPRAAVEGRRSTVAWLSGLVLLSALLLIAWWIDLIPLPSAGGSPVKVAGLDRSAKTALVSNAMALYAIPDGALPPTGAQAAGARPDTYKALIARYRSEREAAGRFRKSQFTEGDTIRYLGDTVGIPLNLVLLRHLVVAQHPGFSGERTAPEVRNGLVKSLDSAQVLPDEQLFLAVARAYRLPGTPGYENYAKNALNEDDPRRMDRILQASPHQGLKPLPDALVKYTQNLSDAAIEAIAPAPSSPTSLNGQIVQWEAAVRKGTTIDADDADTALARYLCIMRGTRQDSKEARRLRDSLWTLLSGDQKHRQQYRQMFLYAVAQAKSRPPSDGKGARRPWETIDCTASPPADQGAPTSRDQFKKVSAVLSATERGRLWHYLLIALHSQPAEIRRLTPELFTSATDDTMARFVSCFAAPAACVAPGRSSREALCPTAPPRTPGDAEDHEQALPQYQSVTHPAIFWRDAVALGVKSESADWLPANLSLADLITVASIETEPSVGKYPKQGQGQLKSRIHQHLRSQGPFSLWPSQIDCWIYRQSSWNPLAFNARGPRFGLFQSDCAAHGTPDRAACRERFLADPAQWLREDLDRLAEVLQHETPGSVHLWARFYAGEQGTETLRQQVSARAEKTANDQAKRFLNDHWYLLLDDTDIALLLLKYEASLQ